MNKILKDQRKRASGFSLNDILRLPPWLLIVALLFLGASCNNAADEQATAERLTVVDPGQISTATRQAEMESATGEAIEAVMSTADAATAGAEEEMAAQAMAEKEATEEAALIATAAAESLATAEAQAAIEAQATTNAQATAEIEATAEAAAQATAQFEATRVAFEAEKLRLVEDAQDQTPVVYLEEGSLVHDEGDEPEAKKSAVNLRNFVVQTQFAFEPGGTALDNGDFGLEFRATAEIFTRLLINQDGSWQLVNEEPGNPWIIQEGETAGLNDGWNEIALYVDEQQGFFLLNSEFVEELDLEQSAEKGDIVLVTGLRTGAEIPGASTDFKDFNIWSLDPIPPTPTPAPTSSDPQPAPVSGHTFPETPIKPFNRDEFVGYLGQIRDSLRSFTSEMNLMSQTGKYGDCGTFNGWVGLWILQAPGYTAVPANFASFYGEYRSLLRQVVNTTQEIRVVCNQGGGEVSDETINEINEFLLWAYPQSEQLVSEASILPGP